MKKLPLLLLALLAFTQAPAQTRYELRGVVSYFYNANQGYRPDVGATAYIVKNGAIATDSLDAGAAEAYRSANVIYSLSPDSKASGLPGEESPREAYLNAKNRLAALERRLARKAAVVTADGQGVFAKKLLPGTYWVLIQSANRSTAQMKKVVIANDDVEVSAKFEAD